MDWKRVKKDFPVLARRVNGKALVYLDSAATSQKPQVVIDAVVDYYSKHNANVHRGIHTLGDESTRMYADARKRVAEFVGASQSELVFVSNTTEAINLVGYGYVRNNLNSGDLIVASELEHHSNLVTWQEAARDSGAGVTFVDVDKNGGVDLDHLEMLLEKLGERIKLVALSWVSNATGSVLDVERMVKVVRRHAKEAKILLDGAQAVPHMRVDFAKSGVDFLAFSGHKMYGPMGVGGLVMKNGLMGVTRPYYVGGGMIDEVKLDKSAYVSGPEKFEAGTPNVAGAIGLAAATEYLDGIGMEEVERHGVELVEYALEKLSKVKELKIAGPVARRHGDTVSRLGSVAFTYEGVHAHDVAQVLDSEGIAVRSGHHCAQPLHGKFDWVATTRASFGVYNDKSDVDRLIDGLAKVKKVFK